MKMWIARNLDDNLTLHYEKPIWYDRIECWSDIALEINPFLFPEVTFENSPMEAELIIKENQSREMLKENAKHYWEVITGSSKPKFKVGDRVLLTLHPCVVTTVEWKGDSKYVGYVYTVRGTDFGKIVKEDELVFDDRTVPNVEVETETHRGYYTTEPETTCEGKKRGVVYFWDNDFEDKVELDLSGGRELIQEDGKWFVVKKKSKYPKTFEECVHVLEGENRMPLELMNIFRILIDARNAYWKIAGEEMGLGKPWEPDWTNDNAKYSIYTIKGVLTKAISCYDGAIFVFPTEEMRDVFYENFKVEIEICKELL